MTVLVVDPVQHPKKLDRRAAGKMILFESAGFHTWIHGPDRPGEKGPMHKHTADQIFVCVQGEATYNFPDRPSAVLKPGMMIIIPKGDFYQIENAGTVDSLLVGARAEPARKPRLGPREEIVDESNKEAAGAKYL